MSACEKYGGEGVNFRMYNIYVKVIIEKPTDDKAANTCMLSISVTMAVVNVIFLVLARHRRNLIKKVKDKLADSISDETYCVIQLWIMDLTQVLLLVVIVDELLNIFLFSLSGEPLEKKVDPNWSIFQSQFFTNDTKECVAPGSKKLTPLRYVDHAIEAMQASLKYCIFSM